MGKPLSVYSKQLSEDQFTQFRVQAEHARRLLAGCNEEWLAAGQAQIAGDDNQVELLKQVMLESQSTGHNPTD